MKNVALLILFTAALAGCAGTLPPKTEVVYVDKIITKECPAPAAVEDPDLYFNKLTDADKKDPGKVVQYWKATVKQLQGAVRERDAIIDGYRKKDNEVK